jgi:hypothetical protein
VKKPFIGQKNDGHGDRHFLGVQRTEIDPQECRGLAPAQEMAGGAYARIVNERGQVQREGQRQQARPQFHSRADAAAAGIEDLARRGAEAAAGGRGDLAQQRFVVAVFPHLVFLAVEAHLGEGARIRQRAHAEEPLVLADPQAPAIVAGGHLAHLQRRLETVGAENEDVGNLAGSSTLRESR